ncbi:MAG: GNAT family N-acetyltransferase [candidate division WOR-3 bacterium]
MASVEVKDVTLENIIDLCLVCVPEEKRNDPDWQRGIEEKRTWAVKMLERIGSFAKVAYIDETPAGMIQYHPLPEQEVVEIDCIYVHEKRFWRKGAGNALLGALIEEMKKPIRWFENRPAKGLIVHPFPGESEGQLSARDFFTHKGFKPVGDDRNILFLSLQEGFVYQPKTKIPRNYQGQAEDKGRVLIFCGPNNCPAAYPFFLKRMERYIREVDSKVPIDYVDISLEPDFVRKRNADYGDCVVNGKLIKAFVLDKDGFQEEVKAALKDS